MQVREATVRQNSERASAIHRLFPRSPCGTTDRPPPGSLRDFPVKRESEGDDDGCHECEKEEEENAPKEQQGRTEGWRQGLVERRLRPGGLAQMRKGEEEESKGGERDVAV
ncbi:hypothetical protein NDU88_004479 [Pleurodeles waltl]|uniref:Uncharacterized protein n=1 Tax=Pleurodeles waltl TaxID=8319 RepID=A0AAV7W9V0_PLEWA|nr:hypothetical protein NDU88_004479 [Pleurodeles waltl]